LIVYSCPYKYLFYIKLEVTYEGFYSIDCALNKPSSDMKCVQPRTCHVFNFLTHTCLSIW